MNIHSSYLTDDNNIGFPTCSTYNTVTCPCIIFIKI